MRIAVRLKTIFALLTMVGISLGASTNSYASWGYGSGGSWGSRGGGSNGGSWGASRGGSNGGGVLRRFATRIHSIHTRGSSGGQSTGGGSSGGRSWGGSSSGGSSGGGSSGHYASRGWGSSGGGSSGGSYVVNGSHGSSGGSHGGSSGQISYAPSYSGPIYSAPVTYADPSMYGTPLMQGYSMSEGMIVPGNEMLGAQSVITNPQAPNESNKPPVASPPANTVNPQPSGNPMNPIPENKDTSKPGDARLRIHLPADALVFVNGKRTKTTGTTRSYLSRNLAVDQMYPYEVKAVVVREGKELVQTKVVDMTAGFDKSVEFSFNEDSEVLTSLSLSVPADAKVVLGGSETSTNGSFRYFSTKTLAKGQSWSNYDVVVSVVRDGKDVTRRQVITLAAGDSQQLNFDFGDATTLVAAK